MQQRVLKTLEYDRILALIAEKAATESAKKRIEELTPTLGDYDLQRTFTLTGEAYDTIRVKGNIPAGGYKEVREYVIHAQKGGTLRGGALLKIASAIKYAQQIKRFIFSEEYESFPCENLKQTAGEITDLKSLASSIESCILGEDEISDNASPALSAIRRKMRRLNASLKDKLSSYTKSDTAKYLQEQLVTMRNGRYVIPVKSEYKGSVDGIVHDTSQSGMTLFVEPRSVINMNNELRTLESEEAREIDIILAEFSQKVAQKALELTANEDSVILLDELFAKAGYAYERNYTKPLINKERYIELFRARHPLLDPKKAVASDLRIGRDYTQIVITGPNTGGKTVALKTLGVCLLMAQSGLFIPAGEGSSLCTFENIYADIGDEQSIEQSLSTFSSHMTNISSILNDLDENCLVLLDELGAGTDPSEGAALAKAILKFIRDKGAMCVATTHYNEIKQYALTERGIVNANVEFDTVNLKPTFRLTIGLPGKSNAFEISRRLGISEQIIEEAKNEMDMGDARFEDLITELNDKIKDATQSRDEAHRALKQAREAEEQMNSELEKLKASKNKMYTEAVVSAKQIVNNAKKAAKDIISSADKYSKGSSDRSLRNEASELAKAALDELNSLMPKHAFSLTDDPARAEYDFKKGDDVEIPELSGEGSILEIKEDTALVQIGSIKTRIALSKLRPGAKKKEKTFSYTGSKAQSASPTLDIRGITGQEAQIEVEKFLDDATLANLKVLTIIHGKGEGVLRKKVTQILQEHPLVESFRLGGLSEGAGGATIVYMK
ncbi:MAG: endonuclease MutS2 [Eubacteriaceae bacterium]|nr:endonuclease MutS2 [Eubacteriaceae bacterium]